MKTVNRICQVLAVAFSLTALVMFFMKFVNIVSGVDTIGIMGTQLAFGGKVETAAGVEYAMAKSAKILFCFLLTAIGFIMSIFSFKSKKLRYAAPVFGIIPAVFMLVMVVRPGVFSIDARPIPNVAGITFTAFAVVCTVMLFLFTAAAVAYLLIDDRIEASESKDKLTIPQRVVRFFRDYKSDCKKIVWPGIRDVLKNTGVVLIICLIIGALIWLFDKGLGELLELILVRK